MKLPNDAYKRLRAAPKFIRLAVGAALVVGGLFGFLPVLGFWMIPLGLAVMFIDTPRVKRAWSRLRLRWRARSGRDNRADR